VKKTIPLDEVRATAALARLSLEPAEVLRLSEELGAILGYLEQLSDLDLAGVPPMTHAVALACPLRSDEVGPSLGTERALGCAPRRDGDYFQVPRVIAHDKDAG
jgi:aspartyl-tRNA(Asn)/glutamyl-tRNA(Gln) amidotransferase subunit C